MLSEIRFFQHMVKMFMIGFRWLLLETLFLSEGFSRSVHVFLGSCPSQMFVAGSSTPTVRFRHPSPLEAAMVFNAVAMSNLHVLVFFVVFTHPQHMVHMMNSTAKKSRLCRNRAVQDVRWQAFVRTSESQIPAFGHMCVFFRAFTCVT